MVGEVILWWLPDRVPTLPPTFSLLPSGCRSGARCFDKVGEMSGLAMPKFKLSAPPLRLRVGPRMKVGRRKWSLCDLHYTRHRPPVQRR